MGRRTTRRPTHEEGAAIAQAAVADADLAYSRALTAYEQAITRVDTAQEALLADATPERMTDLRRARAGLIEARAALDDTQLRRVIAIVTGGQIMTDVLHDVMHDLRALQTQIADIDTGARLRDQKLDRIMALLSQEASA